MTIDERLQFLLTSSESLRASTQKLHATVQAMQEHSGQLAIDAENIRALLRIAEIQ